MAAQRAPESALSLLMVSGLMKCGALGAENAERRWIMLARGTCALGWAKLFGKMDKRQGCDGGVSTAPETAAKMSTPARKDGKNIFSCPLKICPCLLLLDAVLDTLGFSKKAADSNCCYSFLCDNLGGTLPCAPCVFAAEPLHYSGSKHSRPMSCLPAYGCAPLTINEWLC